MTSRERVKKAIYFEGPDRIPHYLPDGKENDIFWLAPWTVACDAPEDIQPWTQADSVEERIDCWSVTWQRKRGSTGKGQAKAYPIQDITRQQDYQFPDLNNPDYYHAWGQTVHEAKAHSKYIVGVAPFNSLNEGTHNIRGLHHMFLDYYEHPEDLKGLIARLASKQRESFQLLAGMGCDGVFLYDDWGLQNSLMISQELLEEFFMPFYRTNWAFAHEAGLDVWLHSCGYIIEILPLFIEAGLSVIQMDQQENMGLKKLAGCAGGKLCFWCPVDIQNTMIQGSLEDIERYAKRMIQTLGGYNGGFMSMAYTSPEDIGHTPEKTQVMCESFRKYGVYTSASACP